MMKEAGLLMPAFLVLILGVRQALSLSLINTVLCVLMGLLMVPLIIIKGLSERKLTRSRQLDRALFSMSYRYGLLIQSGHSLRKALIMAMESDSLIWRAFPVWHETRIRLQNGGDYELALLRLLTFNHSGTKSWARCCLYGERKSEADLIGLLHDWMDDFKMIAEQTEAASHVKGQLGMMMPALLQFGVLMLLLISPIFLGGINT
ncbi:hypothetical protein [Acidaminobacter sp.]|uniref:hypothetical protein n=1 Tax=Acidaminobacter sp. TaxID=1872102 RepID=UPI002609C4BB|nr:hypothetical protein [Acidaminobacter sp.]